MTTARLLVLASIAAGTVMALASLVYWTMDFDATPGEPGVTKGVHWADAPAAPAAAPFTDSSSRERTLAEFKGRTLIVNLWATWCAPCVEELPSLDRLAAMRAGEIKIIAISLDRDGPDVVPEFFEVNGIKTLERYFDASMRVMWVWKAQSLPTTLVVDPSGREVARVIGAYQWDGEDAAALIDRARTEP